MPCYHPIKAWTTGKYEGKRNILFKNPGEGAEQLGLPCGHCIGCRKKHANDWSVRAINEASMHEDNCFVTLTYRDEDLPKGETLVPEHLTKFLKRLRKYIYKTEGKTIKYFACGEYGDKGDRPHYHLLIFGYDFRDKKAWKTQKDGTVRYYISDRLAKIWPYGYNVIAPVTIETARYVTGYVLKKRGKRFHEDNQRLINVVDYETGELYTKTLKYYERINPITGNIHSVEPEFVRMSRGNAKTRANGIGYTWFQKYGHDYYHDGTIHIQGKIQGMPKYYENLFAEKWPERLEEIKQKREEFAKANQEDYTSARLEQKEKCAKARMKKLERNLSLGVGK